MYRTTTRFRNKQWTKQHTGVENTEYVDDVCLIVECLVRTLELLDMLAEESGEFGLNMNGSRTKIITITKKKLNQPTINHAGEDIEIVDTVVYFRSEMKAEGGPDSEVKRRIALARSTFSKLQKIFFKK